MYNCNLQKISFRVTPLNRTKKSFYNNIRLLQCAHNDILVSELSLIFHFKISQICLIITYYCVWRYVFTFSLGEPMLVLYICCVFGAIFTFLWLLITDVRKSLSQNIMALLIIVTNFGYLALAMSKNLETAILSNKIIYIGGTFLHLLFFFNVCEICHIKIPKKIVIIQIIFQLIIYASSLTIGYSSIFYKSVEFHILDGIGFFYNKNYGPFHTFFIISIYAYLLLSVFVMLFAHIKNKSLNFHDVYIMLASLLIAILSYFLERIFHFKFDIMPITYLLMHWVTLLPIYRSNIFNVTENKNVVTEQMNQIGYISFNKKMEYMGANDFSLNLFGELKNCRVGKEIKNPSKELNEIIKNINDFRTDLKSSSKNVEEKSYIKTISINNQFFNTKVYEIKNYRKKCVGFSLELKDETEHLKMIELQDKFNEELKIEVENKTQKIREIQNKIVLGMAQMVESRDLSTGGHVKRTSDVVRIFAKSLQKYLNFNENFLNLVIRSAPMHDLGKIGVDDAVLRKQGKFTDEEYNKMKMHPIIGGYLIKQILVGVEEENFVRVAYNVASFHHEKVNGKGYPNGLKGEEIPIEARIMALADVFDALVSKRCYKDAFSYEKAFEIIKQDSGTHFDTNLANVFLRCKDELINYYENSAKA